MEKSRLKKQLQKRALQNVLLAIAGVIIIVVILFSIGPKLLIGFSLLAGKFSSNDPIEVTEQSNSYIAPPIIESPFEATNSALVNITGSTKPDTKVVLYVNSSKTKTITSKDDGKFTFIGISLKDGPNTVKAKTIENNSESNYSNEIQISRLNKNPNLEIETPSDGQKYKKEESPIKIKGKTDPGVKITVNDFWAIVDAQGIYTYSYNLKDGENTLTIIATDQAGNQTTKSLKIQTE